MNILLIQGANMEHLGRRLPELYGTTTAKELAAVAKSACKYKANPYDRSEPGQAEFFADLYQGRACYDPDRTKWYLWAGHWWQEDRTNQIRQWLVDAARLRGANASKGEDGTKERAFAKSLANGPTRAHATTKRVLQAWRSGGVAAADRVTLAEIQGMPDVATGERLLRYYKALWTELARG